MRLAVIDCGTNTFNLLIADVIEGKVHYRFRTKRVIKLGDQGISKGIIGLKAQERAISALIAYKQIATNRKVEFIKAVGTAALRDTKNGAALLQKIKITTGLKIELIDGNQEAQLICEGVRKALPLGDAISLILDIGGGSVEFILCNSTKIFWKRSFKIGAARLVEKIQPSEPITLVERKKLNLLLRKELNPLLAAIKKHPPQQLIGSSGTFDTFAAMILHKKGNPGFLRGKTTYAFNLMEYHQLHKELVNSTYKERLKMPGMLKMRADMIVPASLLLTFVLKLTAIKNLQLSTYSLKEGLMATLV